MFRTAHTSGSLSILYVSYPLLSISEESVGGAEQMLLALESEMSRRGHRTTVAASNGSSVSGRLLATGEEAKTQDAYCERERQHDRCILDYLHAHPDEFDLIHDESGSFFRHAARCPVPVLATLHLPHSFYPDFWFGHVPSNLHFNCVSDAQSRSFARVANMTGVVQNGISIEKFPFSTEKRDYLLWMGRICEEKAPHIAIEAARTADTALIIAGQVYPFTYHEKYFEREIQPALRGDVQFIDSPSLECKLNLLRHARALVITSTAEETSSLVAMEAMACGTPVIAARRGAFPEIVAHGETGFIVDDVEEMAAAVDLIDKINPATCRRAVEERFCATRMAQQYEELYQSVLAQSQQQQVAA